MRRGSSREDARRGPRIADGLTGAAAILAAGGTGVRVGAERPKQFLELEGRPMIRWSCDAITRAGITEVVVVVPSNHVDEATDLFGSNTHVVAGGPTRQESVRLGLQHVTQERVVVHDAARPFAPAALFAQIVEALEDVDAVVPGLQMQETVKVVRDGTVVETLEREEIWNIQTPQAFWTERLREAHAQAAADGFESTDDAQLIEHWGGRVSVVPGHPDAFKITQPADVERAEAFARQVLR